MADEVPRVLAGRYEIGEIIGRGGMAEVHIGRDTRLNRTVAIKLLRSDLVQDTTFQARFRREAQSAASLNHPAIVSVYDTGEEVYTDARGTEQRMPYIVMEYVEGHTVRDLLRDGAALPIDEAVEITEGVLAALEYSHHAGIVHRDIKPANVMITPTGSVKVMDFGIARAMADESATMTATQAVVGTAQYLSPEQARGEVVDARSDLYSTGCLLFELLTGRPPFVGDSAVAVAYQHVGEQPQPPSTYAPDVPEALDRIVMKSLQKNRDDRYSSAAHFRTDLERFAATGLSAAPAYAAAPATAAATQVIGSRPTPAPALAPASPLAEVEPLEEDEEPGRNKGLIWTLSIIGVLLLGVAGFFIWKNATAEPPVTTVPVPAIAPGASQADAKAAIEGAGLVMAVKQEASKTIDPDGFIRSEPGEGKEVAKGSTVTAFFSTGPDSVAVPEIAGMTQSQAEATLKTAGLTVSGFVPIDNGTKPKDTVEKTEPAIGEMVPVGSGVKLFIVSGNITMPDLKGKDIDAALGELNALGLKNRVSAEPSDQEPGTVLSQSPDAGSPVPAGFEVALTIAEKPDSAPLPSVVGQAVKDAQKALSDAGFTNVSVDETETSDPSQVGQVISQTPQGGTVKFGDPVTLQVGKAAAPPATPTETPTQSPTEGLGNGNGNGNGNGGGKGPNKT